jgi:hypothetical protein
MATKKQCLELAEENNLNVEIIPSQRYHEVNLPHGYQIANDDERTGLCMSVKQTALLPEVYNSLWADLTWLVSQKPWHKK